MSEKKEAVSSTKDDNLESIVKKIVSAEDEKGRFAIYSMFKITHPHYTTAVNMMLQMQNPEAWEPIRKVYYPTFLDKIKKFFGK